MSHGRLSKRSEHEPARGGQLSRARLATTTRPLQTRDLQRHHSIDFANRRKASTRHLDDALETSSVNDGSPQERTVFAAKQRNKTIQQTSTEREDKYRGAERTERERYS